MPEPNDVLGECASDMLAVERAIRDLFRRQQSDERLARYPVAQRLVGRAEELIDRHLEALHDVLERLGGEPTRQGASGVAGGWSAPPVDAAVSRLLRDDYTALSHASVCYEMLHTTALAAGDGHLARTALRHMEELAPLAVALGEAIPEVVTRELVEQGRLASAAPGVAEEARRNACRAWEQAASHAVL